MRVFALLPVLLLAFQSAGAARLPRQKPVGPGAANIPPPLSPAQPASPPPATPATLPPALLSHNTTAVGPASGDGDGAADQNADTGDDASTDDDGSTEVVWNWAEDGAVYLGMKTLVLYSDPLSLMVPTLYMDGLDTPYKTMNTMPDFSQPSYYAVVVSDPGWNGGNFVPLQNYAKKFNVRVAFLRSKPSVTTNTEPSPAMPGLNSIVVIDSPSAEAMAGIVNTTTVLPLSRLVSPTPASVMNTTGTVAGILKFTQSADVNRTDTGDDYAAVVATPVGGSPEMHFFFNAAAHEVDATKTLNWVQSGEDITQVNLAVANIWFPWITRGLFMGLRRQFLQTHVDDHFLATTQYNSTKTVRTSGEDLQFQAQHQKQLTEQLPEGSDVRIELMFCGAGRDAMKLEQQGLGVGLNNASDLLVGEFNWVSHTFTHIDMDYLEPQDCNGVQYGCPTSPARAHSELQYNFQTIAGLGTDNATYPDFYKKLTYGSTEAGILFFNKSQEMAQRFSPSCLVTPEISGIWPKGTPVPASFSQKKPIPGNTPVLSQFYDFGIRTVVGDNSRPELMNKTSYHYGVWMRNATYGVEHILIIPRHPTTVPYNAPNPEVMMKEYADLKMCPWVAGIACPTDYSNFTLDDALLRLAKYYSFQLLQWRADPFMFHQANLITFQYKNATASLLTLVVDALVKELKKFVVTPIVSPRMEDTAVWYRSRMDRDTCRLTGKIKYAQGKWQMVQINGTGVCKAALTWAAGAANDSFVLKPFPQKSQGQTIERVGSDITMLLPISPRQPTQTVGPPPAPFNGPNLIQDPSFANQTSATIGTVAPWFGSGSINNVGRTGMKSLMVSGFQSGVTQFLTLNQVAPVPLRFSAWSLPNSVTPYIATNNYALVVELQYITNITRTTHIKQFMPNVTTWTRQMLDIAPAAPVKSASVSLLFTRYAEGTVLFDDVSAQQAA